MRRGSFAAVARERNLDPSSVSRTIAGLERELGVRLFNRTTRQLSPTEAALAYFDRLEPLIDELARATQMASDSAEKPHGALETAEQVFVDALFSIVGPPHKEPWEEALERYDSTHHENHREADATAAAQQDRKRRD